MRKRPILLAAAAVAAGLAVFRTVEAQTVPAGGVPKTQPVARGSSDWTTTAPATPPGYSPTPAGKGQPVRPRLTSPVMAGPDGVRPVGGQFPLPNLDTPPPPPTVEPPFSPGVPVTPSVPGTPKVSQDPPAGGAPTVPVIPLPSVPTGVEPRPLVPVPSAPSGGVPHVENTGPKVPAAPPEIDRTPGTIGVPAVSPMGPAATLPGNPASSPLSAKMSQSVTIEAICPATVGYGGEFRYELVVKNMGTSAVAGVRVEDAIPSGAKYVGSDPPAELLGDRLAWAVGTLDAGGEKRIAVRLKPSAEGELASRATVTYSASVEARTTVTRPRLAVSVSGGEVCKAGEEAIFQIKITNSGTGPAQQMVVQALLSEGLLHSQGYKLEMPATTLAAGETKTVPLRVSAAKAGVQTCQVSVAAVGVADTASRASVNVVEPVLQIAQSGPAKCYVRGSEPVYEIKLANTGTAATDAVTMYSVLPEGFEFVEGSDGASFSAANRAVVWKLSPMAPGTNKAFTLKLRATVAGEGVLRTIAQGVPEQGAVGAGGVAAKPAGRPQEAKADTAIRAEGVAAVRFEVIDLDDPVPAGGEAVYEIRVLNQGTGACSNVQLVAALADGTAYTGSSGPTQVKAQGQSLVFDPIATLAVKGEAVYRVKVRGNAAGDLRFRVQLSCDQVRTPVVKEESTRFFKE